MNVAPTSALPVVFDGMSLTAARKHVEQIKAEDYAESGYSNVNNFVVDVAAILKSNPDYKDRLIKRSKKKTVWTNLTDMKDGMKDYLSGTMKGHSMNERD